VRVVLEDAWGVCHIGFLVTFFFFFFFPIGPQSYPSAQQFPPFFLIPACPCLPTTRVSLFVIPPPPPYCLFLLPKPFPPAPSPQSFLFLPPHSLGLFDHPFLRRTTVPSIASPPPNTLPHILSQTIGDLCHSLLAYIFSLVRSSCNVVRPFLPPNQCNSHFDYMFFCTCTKSVLPQLDVR